jgi:signal transduction histidine kinase
MEARRTMVEIVREVPDDLPSVAMDGEELRQVILNLVMNGIQAMEGGGRLLVTAARPDDGLLSLSIRDTGPGIPAELLPRIFDPFVTGRASGTGLGLSIVQRILANHGASIRVSSVAGQGTTMEVRIPLGEVVHAT